MSGLSGKSPNGKSIFYDDYKIMGAVAKMDQLNQDQLTSVEKIFTENMPPIWNNLRRRCY